MNILFKFASRSRPQKLIEGIANIQHFCKSDNYLILVSLDKDDPTCQGMKSTDKVKIVYGNSTGKIDAINRDLKGLKYKWDILVNFSDDMRFTVYGFDDIIRKAMKENFPDTDGVLFYWDGNKSCRDLMTMSIIGREYYNRDGYIYNPEYVSLFCDNEAQEVAIQRGKFKKIEGIIIFNHLHWAHHKGSVADKQALHNDSFFKHDEITYRKRKANNFYI